MEFLHLIILLLVSALAKVQSRSVYCPMDCYCENLDEYTFKAMCPPKEHGTEYAVTRSSKSGVILIDCVRNISLSEGFLEMFKFAEPNTAVHFRMCSPPSIPFSSLIKPFNVTSLTYSSFTHWTSIKSDLFVNMTNLQQLSLKGNDLTSIDAKVFGPLTSLTSLTLSENALESVPSNLKDYLPKLQHLDLSINNISNLRGDDFSGLTDLRTLILFNNTVRNLSGRIFTEVPNLTALDLRGNMLRTISADVFETLPNLARVDISYNKIIYLPTDLFSTNINLRYVAISGNKNLSELFETMFHNLTLLEELDLSNNNLTSLPEKFLESSVNLKHLDVEKNRIGTLYPLQFENCTNLEILILRNNRIKSIPAGTFSNLNNLIKLDITHNEIRIIEGKTFTGFKAMTSIDLSHNNISQINTTAFVNSRIALMNISNNPFMFTSQNPAFILPDGVQLINITRTFLVRIPLPWIRSNTLKELDLRRNRLMSLQVEIPPPQNIPHILNIYLEGNIIEEVEMISMNRSTNNRANKFERFIIQYNLDSNPLKCDCNMFPFVQYMRRENHDIYATVKFLGHIKCISPINLEDVYVEALNDDDLLCQVLKDCPTGCYCYTKGNDKDVHVSCPKMNIDEFPKPIPAKISHLDLTNNYISVIPNMTAPLWNTLNQLDLGFNHMSNLTKPVFLPTNLTFLALNHNQLKVLPPWFMTEVTKRNMKIMLGNNPWECSCKTVPFVKWIKENPSNIGDMNAIKCFDSAEKDHLLMTVNTTTICPDTAVHKGVSAAGVVIFLLAIMVVILIAAGIVVRKRQQSIKLWLFRHHMCLWMMKEDDRASGHPL